MGSIGKFQSSMGEAFSKRNTMTGWGNYSTYVLKKACIFITINILNGKSVFKELPDTSIKDIYTL